MLQTNFWFLGQQLIMNKMPWV